MFFAVRKGFEPPVRANVHLWIRTPGTRKRTPVFEAGSFNHSDTSPLGLQIYD